MSKILAYILDIAESSFNAFTNILFILQITVSMWIVISVICVRSLYTRKGLIINLEQLRNNTVQAKLGSAPR